MNAWKIVSLNDLGEVNRGRSRHRPRNDPKLYGGEFPFIQTGDIKASQGLVTAYSQTYSELGLKQSRLWPRGTMAITIAANIAETAILDFPACFPDSVIGFVADPSKANVRFVEYLFRFHRRQIQSENVGTGSAQDNINLQTIGSLELSIPDLKGQNEIAAILGALDDKIELNRKMAATLEEMARALYRSWFVDFDPVHARSQGLPPAHMPPTTAALFPDSFGDDGLPEGWDFVALDTLGQVTMGLSPKGTSYNDIGEGTPLCNGPVEYGEYFLRQIKWTTAPTRMASRGDLIICVRGSTTGRHAFADADYCIGRGVALVRGLAGTQEFVETALLSDIARLLEKTTGSVFPSLSKDDLQQFDIINPGQPLVKKFSELIRPMRDKTWQLVEENQTLATLRDTLLPRLMSGELRVGEAREKI